MTINSSKRELLQAGMLLTSGAHLVPAATKSFAALTDLRLTGDGLTDDSRALQQAYDNLARGGGGRLILPPGKFRIHLRLHSRNVSLSGAGIGATVLQPADPDGVALLADYQNGNPQSVEIADLSLAGSAAGRSTLFAAGAGQGRDTAYSGSTAFTRVAFNGARYAIRRENGSIGLWVDRCRFYDNDFDFHVRSTDATSGPAAMHGGCMTVSRSWLTGFKKAMCYVDSPTNGSGQIIFDGNIVEFAAGFVLYVNAFNSSLAPGIVMRDQWNEATGTGRDVEIEGRRHARAGFLFAQAIRSPVLLENTPPGHCVLRGASLFTRNCDLTMLGADADDASSLRHENAYAFQGTPPGLAASIATPPQPQGLRTPWFEMPLPTGRSPFWRDHLLWQTKTDQNLEVRSARGTIAVSGIRSTVEIDGSHRFEIGVDKETYIGSATPHAHDWLVALYLYRLDGIAGSADATIELNGANGLTGRGSLRGGGWRMLVGLCRVGDAPQRPVGFLHRAERPVWIQLGAAAILRFTALQAALDFANRGVLPS